jgi:hypothetical protein
VKESRPAPSVADMAYQLLSTWFLQRYEDPGENCPYESAEGGYQYIWGGPYDAGEELHNAWAGIFDDTFLESVATRLEADHGCYEWSGTGDADERRPPIAVAVPAQRQSTGTRSTYAQASPA